MNDLPLRLDAITATNDYAFKKLFGTEENKDIMIEFVSLVTNMNKADFEDVKIENTELSPRFFTDKRGRVDVKIALKNGAKIDVEMQNIFFSDYPKRSLYYWAQLFLENFNAGYEYSHLNKCISINILNAPFPLTDKLHSEYKILEVEKHTPLDDVFEMHFFDLTKLKESDMSHTMSEIEQWLLFIKTKDDAVRQGLSENNPVMSKANEALKHFYLTDEDRKFYLMANNARIDFASIRGDGIREGREEGLREGREEGMKEGITQGRLEGITQGREEGKFETARNCLSLNLPLATISKITGLSIEEIEKLS